MVEQFLVKMMKTQRPAAPIQSGDGSHTLEFCPIHLFRIRKSAKGSYMVTYSEGKFAQEMGMNLYRAECPLHEMVSLQAIEQWEPFFEQAFSGYTCYRETNYGGRSLHTTLAPVMLEGRVLEIVGTTIDCTGGTKLKDQLALNTQRYKEIFNNTLNPTLLLNDYRVVLDANHAACTLLGIKEGDLNNSRLDDFIPTDERDGVLTYWRLFMHEPDQKMEFSMEDSEERKIVEFSGKKDILPGVHLGILLDVTEQRQTEIKLRKAETLNVVGELAAGVAHEIRNPLTSLKGFIQLIQNENQEHKPYYSIILNEVDRIEYIIKEFLLLAKTDRQHIEKSNLLNTLHETVSLLQTQAILKNIGLELKVDENLPDINCDPFQIKQVFINLIKNAIEATEDGGSIHIKAVIKNKHYVAFSFTDNGAGMPNQVLDRIGKPFYTTKEEGTGLGLMVSYKIIENHKGTVRVTSEVGKGTTFEVILPV